VIDGGLGRDAAYRIVGEHRLKQIDTHVIEIVADLDSIVSFPLGKTGLEVGIRRDARPIIF
jgi:hypothetical protein